jgi:hypothetical protein
VVDEQSEGHIARYGELLDGDADEIDCVDQLSDVVVDALNHLGVQGRRSRPGTVTSARTIACRR